MCVCVGASVAVCVWQCVCECNVSHQFSTHWRWPPLRPLPPESILLFLCCHLQPCFHPSADGRIRVYSDYWPLFLTFESILRMKVHFKRVSLLTSPFTVTNQMSLLVFLCICSFVSGRVWGGGLWEEDELIYMTRSSKLPTSEILSHAAAEE